MPRWIAMSLLVISPLVVLGLTALVLKFARDLRRSFGAVSETPASAIAVAGLFLALHAGYAAAPFLLTGGRRTLALWLTTPLAAVATLLLLSMMATQHLRPGSLGQGAALFAFTVLGLLATYWGPVASLAWSR